MAILCDQQNITISGTNTPVCDILVRISNIRPMEDSIDIQLDNSNISPQVNTTGNSFDYNNKLITLKLISKSTSEGTAIINVTVSDLPPDVATHRIDLIVEPWSTYTSDSALQEILIKLTDIDGAFINFFAEYGISDYKYINTEIVKEGNNVIVRANLKKLTTETLALPLLANVVITVVAVGIIFYAIGRIKDILIYAIEDLTNFGPKLTNDKLTGAGTEFVKNLSDDCVSKTCSDTTLTQDQKAECIKNCNVVILTNWKDYQNKVYPDADHSDLDTGKTNIQSCLDVYNLSTKTEVDYTTYINCVKVKNNSSVDPDKDKTLTVYKPNAQAGNKDETSLSTVLIIGAGLLGLAYLLGSRK